MILPAQTIRRLGIFEPFHEATVFNGMTYGLSHCGYDVRIRETITLDPMQNRFGTAFALASTIEHFAMPNDVAADVKDKSSWARLGLAVQNTFIEPGWRGWLTLELTNHGRDILTIPAGSPIAQIVLYRLEEPTERPYGTGKYQDQPARPVAAIKAEEGR